MEPNVYLYYGEERYLISQKIKELKSSVDFLHMNYNEFNDITQTNIDICNQVPFMSKSRLVVIDADNIFKLNKDPLLEYLNKKNDFCILVLVTNQIDKRKKLFKELCSKGKVVEFKKLRVNELSKFVIKELQHRGKSIGSKEVDFFISHLGYGLNSKTLYDVISAIDMLGNVENIKITIDDITRNIEKSIDDDIFKLTKFINLKDSTNVHEHLKGLLVKGNNPLSLIGLIQRQYRIIYKALLTMDKENPIDIGVHSFVLKTLSIQDYTLDKVVKAINLCLEHSNLIKIGVLDDNLSLELLISKLLVL